MNKQTILFILMVVNLPYHLFRSTFKIFVEFYVEIVDFYVEIIDDIMMFVNIIIKTRGDMHRPR